MAGINTNRTNIALPGAVSSEIWQKAQEASAVMQLARRVELPGTGMTIPVITGDPEASWVAETDQKPVSNPSLNTKVMTPYKLAVIVPFSKEFTRDYARLYDALVGRLPGALALKYDQTVFAGTSPGTGFDVLTSANAQSISGENGFYGALVDAEIDISEAGFGVNGYALSPQARGEMLAAVDSNDRPIFINSVSEGTIPRLLGQGVHYSRGVYAAGSASTEDVIGFAGDWTQAVYGTVEGVKIDMSEEATLTIDGTMVNLWERNMIAVRAEIEIGFVADITAFNKLTRTHSS